jgi:predicted phosphodiesterase
MNLVKNLFSGKRKSASGRKPALMVVISVMLAGLMLAGCPTSNKENKDQSIDDLAGNPKAQVLWGTRTGIIPNNIGNTFTADPKTTRTITWQSKLNKGEVVIDKTHYPSTSTLNNGWYFHRVDITSLASGETYRYIAGSADAYSPVYSFTTEGAYLSGGFSVLHVTDPQIGTGTNTGDATVWKRVIEIAVKNYPDIAFAVNTGDIVENAVENTIPFYFDYAQKTLANYAFVYSMGNNDATAWYNRHFYTPNNGNDGILYSFDYGNAHFVNVDSNVNLTTGQRTWLENDLRTTTKKWKVVMTHEADYGRSGSNTALTKLFDQYNVDLVMAGHNHFYGRTKPIDTSGNNKQNGTVWSIPNTAGTKFNSTSGQSYLAVDKQPNLQMFSIFKFTETNIHLSAYTVNTSGTVTLFDTYTFR